MLNDNIWCVIMAGGSGTRFWPVSTEDVPKQFVEVAGSGRSFLQTTYDRFRGLVPPQRVIVVTNRRHEGMVRASLPELPAENILSEPYKRDTAPCMAYAMYTILKRDPEAVMVMVPCDHMIMDPEAFRHTISDATGFARDNDVLVTIGIHPTRPDTNYGYIQGVTLPEPNRPVAVKTFTEKPDAELARVFVQSGEFLWNSGIFIWKASVIRREIEKFLPQMVAQFAGWEDAIGSDSEGVFIEKAYSECLKISIDYGIMEKTDSAWVYPADFGWHDVGTWESMYSFFPLKDADGNASNVKTMLKDSSGNLLLSTSSGKLIAVCGLDDYSIVDTEKVLMVCPRDDRKFRDFLSNLAMPEFEKYR